MQDIKERFRVEKQHLKEHISALEAARPRTPSALGSSTYACRSASCSDNPYPTSDFHELEISELPDGSERESELKDDGTAVNDHETFQSNQEHPTDPKQSDSDADGGTTEPPTLC